MCKQNYSNCRDIFESTLNLMLNTFSCREHIADKSHRAVIKKNSLLNLMFSTASPRHISPACSGSVNVKSFTENASGCG